MTSISDDIRRGEVPEETDNIYTRTKLFPPETYPYLYRSSPHRMNITVLGSVDASGRINVVKQSALLPFMAYHASVGQRGGCRSRSLSLCE